MSIFDKIKGAIFGKHAEAAERPTGVNSSEGPAPNVGSTPATSPSAPQSAPSGASPEPQAARPQTTPAPGAPAPAAPSPQPGAGAPAHVDVAAIMDKAVADSGQKLEWRKSIVDTMKALHLDSSLSERKELAKELGYTGSTEDSSAMNVWLHKALMKKLAENGGKVPAELTD